MDLVDLKIIQIIKMHQVFQITLSYHTWFISEDLKQSVLLLQTDLYNNSLTLYIDVEFSLYAINIVG